MTGQLAIDYSAVRERRVGAIRIPSWLADHVRFFGTTGPTVGGVSGGRTSALMHVLALAAGGDYRGVFANTGKEHERTLVFLRRLEEATGVPLTWLEFKRPAERGAPPIESRYDVVDFTTANRDGQPFVDFLRTLAEWRQNSRTIALVMPAAASGVRCVTPRVSWPEIRATRCGSSARSPTKWSCSGPRA